MAERLADHLTEAIIAGDYHAGDTIPTEPELSRQFDVSRSVVRDAVRLLAARGLVVVRHGRGAFVTDSPMDAVADAFRLALRRERATAWDVEEFQRSLLPDVMALAAANGTDAELATIRTAVERYLDAMERSGRSQNVDEIRDRSSEMMNAIVEATHNAVMRLLLPAVQAVRSLRHWRDDPGAGAADLAVERDLLMETVTALESRDQRRVRSVAGQWALLPPEGEDAMRRTPVGETVQIPLALHEFRRSLDG